MSNVKDRAYLLASEIHLQYSKSGHLSLSSLESAIAAGLAREREKENWPRCECGSPIIFDLEEPFAVCVKGCHGMEWGSQHFGDDWRKIQKLITERTTFRVKLELAEAKEALNTLKHDKVIGGYFSAEWVCKVAREALARMKEIADG